VVDAPEEVAATIPGKDNEDVEYDEDGLLLFPSKPLPPLVASPP
jgi:hypothetical protein